MRVFTVFELLIIEESGDEGIDSPLVLYALVPIIPLSRFSRAREFPKPHKRLWSGGNVGIVGYNFWTVEGVVDQVTK